MSQILSIGILLICIALMATHFYDIKNSRKPND
jgi:hypothetical protein